MKFDQNLTTERIKRKYPSQFALVNEMISEARRIIRTGIAPDVTVDTDNIAVIVYSDFEHGRSRNCKEVSYVEQKSPVSESIPS